MQSPRFFRTMGFVISLLSAHLAMADVPMERLVPSHHDSSGSAARYVYHPHFCQSFLLTVMVDGHTWAASYSPSRGIFAQVVDLSSDMPSSVVWVTIDAEKSAYPYGKAATIRPYSDQSLALTVQEKTLSLQKATEGAHNQAWGVMLVPTATFFKLGGSVFTLDGEYIRVANNSNGVLQMEKSFQEDSSAIKTVDAITGQSCAAYLDEKYNHLHLSS